MSAKGKAEHCLVIAYKAEALPMAEDDLAAMLAFRHAAEEVMEAALSEDDSGYLDGGGMGCGDVEIFFYVRDPAWAATLIRNVVEGSAFDCIDSIRCNGDAV